MPVDKPFGVDVSYSIEIGIELPSVGITDTSFTSFPTAIQPPILFGDQMEQALRAFETAVEDVYEGSERLEGISGKLGDFVFLFGFLIGFAARIVCSNTMIH